MAAIAGETLTEAVVRALRERLGRQQLPAKRSNAGLELARMARKFAKLPILDNRAADDILGNDKNSLPS